VAVGHRNVGELPVFQFHPRHRAQPEGSLHEVLGQAKTQRDQGDAWYFATKLSLRQLILEPANHNRHAVDDLTGPTARRNSCVQQFSWFGRDPQAGVTPPSTGCAPSFATDLGVSPLPKVPLTMSASAITRTTKSFVVVGTISLSLVRALGKTSSAIARSGFAWATLPKRMTGTAGALAVVSAGGFVTTTVFRPGGGFSQY
jgi:hypothetical protein